MLASLISRYFQGLFCDIRFFNLLQAEPVNKGQYVKLNIDAESQEEAGSGWDEDDADWDKW